jgi:hypothetical protein
MIMTSRGGEELIIVVKLLTTRYKQNSLIPREYNGTWLLFLRIYKTNNGLRSDISEKFLLFLHQEIQVDLEFFTVQDL